MPAPLLITRAIGALVLAALLTACGGGGGSSSGVAAQSVSTPPPVDNGGSGGSDTGSGGGGVDAGSGGGSGSETGSGSGSDTGAGSDDGSSEGGSEGGAAADDNGTSRQAQPVTDPAPEDPADDPLPTVDLLALVTPDAAARYPEDPALRVEHMVAVANLALEDSGLAVRFAVAELRMLEGAVGTDSESALRAVTAADSGELADLDAWRDAAGADLVVLFRAYANDGVCGLAWIGGTGIAFDDAAALAHGASTVAIDCSDLTLVHELGHNLGLAHSRGEDPDGGHTPWAAGHGVDGEFATIMASPAHFDAPQLTRFSDPSADCLGHPCGVAASDDTHGADAVAVLAETLDKVRAWNTRP